MNTPAAPKAPNGRPDTSDHMFSKPATTPQPTRPDPGMPEKITTAANLHPRSMAEFLRRMAPIKRTDRVPHAFHEVLASMHGKTLTSVIPTIDEWENVEELQFQFSDGTHVVIRGLSNTLDGSSEGCLQVTTDLARRWWA